jgi:hypothetical protein
MFTVHLKKGVYGDNAELRAAVPTLRGAVHFLERFIEFPILVSTEPSQDGRARWDVYYGWSDGTSVATVVESNEDVWGQHRQLPTNSGQNDGL